MKGFKGFQKNVLKNSESIYIFRLSKQHFNRILSKKFIFSIFEAFVLEAVKLLTGEKKFKISSI